jgi:hypothetical protein
MTRILRIRIGLLVAAVAASFAIAASSQARIPVEPGGVAKKAIHARIRTVRSTRNDGGYSRCSGCHVFSAAEARTE